jgi:hypothetical protein
MQRDPDPAISAAHRTNEVRNAYYAADDAHDWAEARRLEPILTSCEYAEAATAPTSNAGAAHKLDSFAAELRLDPCATTERLAQSATRLAVAIERGDLTPLTLRALRALVPATLRYDREVGSDASKALVHAINWCALPKLV